MSEWIKTSDELPDINRWVWGIARTPVSHYHNHCFMVARIPDGWGVYNGGHFAPEQVTHWRPLPEPPQEEQHEFVATERRSLG